MNKGTKVILQSKIMIKYFINYYSGSDVFINCPYVRVSRG
jgi:hypothetical protein